MFLPLPPRLPRYVDHEWGSGYVFYGLLKFFGPPALMYLKIGLAIGALAFGLAAGRKQACDLNSLRLLAIPAAASLPCRDIFLCFAQPHQSPTFCSR